MQIDSKDTYDNLLNKFHNQYCGVLVKLLCQRFADDGLYTHLSVLHHKAFWIMDPDSPKNHDLGINISIDNFEHGRYANRVECKITYPTINGCARLPHVISVPDSGTIQNVADRLYKKLYCPKCS